MARVSGEGGAQWMASERDTVAREARWRLGLRVRKVKFSTKSKSGRADGMDDFFKK